MQNISNIQQILRSKGLKIDGQRKHSSMDKTSKHTMTNKRRVTRYIVT